MQVEPSSKSIPNIEEVFHLFLDLSLKFIDFISLLSVISFAAVLRYSAEGFAYSIKTRHIKYLLLNIFCSCLLLNVVIFKKNHKIAGNLFNGILYLQQGNILKRLFRFISI